MYKDAHGNIFQYKRTEDGCLELTLIEPAQSCLAIPDEIDGCQVVSIGEEACINSDVLKSVTIPSSVSKICKKAFAYDQNLERIEFANGLEVIEGFAFMFAGVQDIAFPSTLRSIGENAFYCCQALEGVELNDGLLSIGDRAFEQTGVKALNIPRTVEHLGTRILHPKDSHQECRILIDPDNPHYISDSEGHGTYAIDREDSGSCDDASPAPCMTLVECRGCDTKYSVLDGTHTIGERAFAFQEELEEVVLPEGLRTIGKSAFRRCRSLRSVNAPSTLSKLDEMAFYDCGLKFFDIPADLLDIDDSAFLVNGSPHEHSRRHSIKLSVSPDNPKYFMSTGVLCAHMEDGYDKAVIYTETTSKVSLLPTVRYLGMYLFYGASGIEELYLHDNIAAFDSQAFGVLSPVKHVHITLREPYLGRSEYDMYFMRNGSFSFNFIQIFRVGKFDIDTMIETSDIAICYMSEGFERAKLMIERLLDPILLTARHEKQMRAAIERGFKRICKTFGERNYNQGFTELIELGFIDESNIDDAIEQVHAAGSVASSGFLLEKKHELFGKNAFSSYEL